MTTNISINWDEFNDFPRVLGISCHSKPVKLSWEISRNPDFFITRKENIVNNITKSEHICFEISHKDTQEKLLLLSNKGSSDWFNKKNRNLDYFIVDRNSKSDNWEQFNNLLRDIESVIFATEIELNENSKENDYFLDIE